MLATYDDPQSVSSLLWKVDQVVNGRVSFLKEEIKPQYNPLVNFLKYRLRLSVEPILKSWHGSSHKRRRTFENAGDMDVIEKLYTELDASEWLQRQVVKVLGMRHAINAVSSIANIS